MHPPPRYLSKTLAAWLALLAGCAGLHRFYLRGLGDPWGWLHPVLALPGLWGVLRMRELGQDDRLSWLLIPMLGVVISAAALQAIVIALTPDERWDATRNPGQPARATRWGPVLAAIAGLMVGGAVLMGSIAFGIQKLFEAQL